MRTTILTAGAVFRAGVGPIPSPSSFSSSYRVVQQAFASTSYAHPAGSSACFGRGATFSTSSVVCGKSRPGQGKDARMKAKKAAQSGQNAIKKDESMPLAEAIRVLKAVEIARPLNAFELHIVTSVDSHQSNSLRGRLALPRDPRTKSEKLLIFAESGSPAAQTALNAKSAAASESEIIIGGGEIINDVLSNRISGFSKVLATPSLMPQISKELARSLGPRGLMPSAKRGTVAATAEEMQQAIQEAKGAMDWRGDRQGVVRGAVGRIHFTPEDLKRNITSFLLAIVDKVSGGAGTTSAIFSGSAAAAEARDPKKSAAMMRRASGVIKQVHLSSTQGPGILVKLPELI